ncbi:hypothetical protein BDP27DRAFT_266941 [Rhodocollybia butyracea]|uniref:Uncharacterized protein n=1 Tax=Rhodocollybia butyracea TaxID=206335 RepID=A0A9P5Q2X6_9AGAR|nr:hypothetical protein BDP27DRAFT_266941 [Rhodocollybia butyracea]
MAISLKLIPAIDEAVLIAVPEWHTTSSSVELRFSAVLDDDELQQLKKDGVKVQVWSDIPAGGRTEGDWGEIELHEVVSDGSSDVSLVTLGDDNNLNTFLSAVCSVPYPSKDFSFTYRLVYPSGHVQWLGYFGRNGTIHFERTSSDISGVVFGEGWTTMRAPFTWNTRGRLVEDVPIVRLVSPEEWTIWSLGKDSFCEGATNEASLLFLVPRLRPYAIYCPRTLILSASLDTSISVSAAGHIHASGEGSLFLQTFEPSLGSIDSFLDSVLGPTHLEYQLLGIFKHYIVLTSAGSSVQAIIIPLLPQAFASHIAISSESLARILSAARSTNSLARQTSSSVPRSSREDRSNVPFMKAYFTLRLIGSSRDDWSYGSFLAFL